MKFITYFIIFTVFYTIFNWIIEKTDIHNKLFGKTKKYKYARIVLSFMLILFAFSFEYWKQLLNEKYGQHNYFSLIVGAFLGAICLNFCPIIFRRNNP